MKFKLSFFEFLNRYLIAFFRDSITIYLFLSPNPDLISLSMERKFSFLELSSVMIDKDELLSTVFAIVFLLDLSLSPPHPNSVVILEFELKLMNMS